MGTRSFIAQRVGDEYVGVYCHWDGYLEHNGRILLEHYGRGMASCTGERDMRLTPVFYEQHPGHLRKDLPRSQEYVEEECRSLCQQCAEAAA